MIQRTLVASALAMLCACSSTKPAPEIPLDMVRPAQLEPEPPRPVQLIEIPKPLALPGQLKRLPDVALPQESTDPKQRVSDANSAARVEPALDGYINAMQVWPFSPAALYQVYTSPGRVTDLMLQAGEQLVDISTPDTVRWVVGDTSSGSGPDQRVHIGVKPTRSDLQSNLIIYTDRRTYYIELKSQVDAWMAGVSWDYPHDRAVAIRSANQQQESVARSTCSSVPLDQLHFRYEITGDKPTWRPLRAFDDGQKVFIQFADAIAQGEMAPLFVIGRAGETQLVNYRVCASYYIVDRLFGAAELRLGAKHAQIVRITRNDVARSQPMPRSHK